MFEKFISLYAKLLSTTTDVYPRSPTWQYYTKKYIAKLREWWRLWCFATSKGCCCRRENKGLKTIEYCASAHLAPKRYDRACDHLTRWAWLYAHAEALQKLWSDFRNRYHDATYARAKLRDNTSFTCPCWTTFLLL